VEAELLARRRRRSARQRAAENVHLAVRLVCFGLRSAACFKLQCAQAELDGGLCVVLVRASNGRRCWAWTGAAAPRCERVDSSRAHEQITRSDETGQWQIVDDPLHRRFDTLNQLLRSCDHLRYE
jgi:hypothetical protein